jgi:hypothetical protein
VIHAALEQAASGPHRQAKGGRDYSPCEAAEDCPCEICQVTFALRWIKEAQAYDGEAAEILRAAQAANEALERFKRRYFRDA